MKRLDRTSTIVLLAILILNAFVWYEILSQASTDTKRHLYFLDIGQGDSELLVLPKHVSILTDAGPDSTVTRRIEKIFPTTERYIDLGIITHPQLDHYGGFLDLIKRYEFGAILVNGREADSGISEWTTLITEIKARNIPLIIVKRGDRITYENTVIDVLSPDQNFIQSAELNDTALVTRVTDPFFTALFTADTGMNIESYLLQKGDLLNADILKIGHHGSKFSSGKEFLSAVNPKIAIIEVGKNNHYGHPARETLDRLESTTNAHIVRTDRDGTIELRIDGPKILAFTEHHE